MNNQTINTTVKDYGDKKISSFKMAIIMSVAFIIVAGLMIYSLYPKFKNVHFMVNTKDDNYIDASTTTVSVNDSIDVEEIKSDDYLIYKLTNKTGATKDITLRLNTYVNDEVENSISREVTAISNNYSTYVYIPISELKIYDKYDYTINSINTFYHSALDGGIKESISDVSDDYIFTNNSDSFLNLSVVVFYYEGNSIKEIKSYSKTQLEKDDSYTVSINNNYSYYEVHLVDAYSVK